MASSGIAIGSGTEQQESTTVLGRPVMMLRVLSSEYKLHHVCTRDSRFVALAEGSSFLTWRPREKADRRAIPTIVHALAGSVHSSLQNMVILAGYSPTDLPGTEPVEPKKTVNAKIRCQHVPHLRSESPVLTLNFGSVEYLDDSSQQLLLTQTPALVLDM